MIRTLPVRVGGLVAAATGTFLVALAVDRPRGPAPPPAPLPEAIAVEVPTLDPLTAVALPVDVDDVTPGPPLIDEGPPTC